eukprot:244614-Prorocentrum_minimum.AAC.1
MEDFSAAQAINSLTPLTPSVSCSTIRGQVTKIGQHFGNVDQSVTLDEAKDPLELELNRALAAMLP